jgi:hypothetical protein
MQYRQITGSKSIGIIVYWFSFRFGLAIPLTDGSMHGATKKTYLKGIDFSRTTVGLSCSFGLLS